MAAGTKYDNPPRQLPIYVDTPETIQAIADEYIASHKALLDKIVSEVTVENATFANVLHPVLVHHNEHRLRTNTVDFYQYVSANADLRAASTKVTAAFGEYDVESSMREDYFELLDAAFQKRDSQKLGTEAKYLLEYRHAILSRKGLLLKGEAREKFSELSKKISKLTTQANEIYNSNASSFWVDPARLDGVPKDDIDPETLEKGTGENEGKVKLNFKYIHLLPLIKYAKDESLRKEYSIADANSMNDNIPVMKQLIMLRDEAARLLGYRSHADGRLGIKMAKTPEAVWEFLNNIRYSLKDTVTKEVGELAELKKKDHEARGIPYEDFYSWDVGYYSRLQLEQKYQVDENAVAEYLPTNNSFNGMLNIFEKIFGLKFVQLDEEHRAKFSTTGNAKDVVWHEDVFMYSVWENDERGGSFVGYLYLDLHPRDNKYGHYANFNIDSGFANEDGSRHYPVTALVCNFSKPSAEKPALLKHHELVTFFHELGHGIHDLVSKTLYTATHGTETVRDFVEAPSQMLENWCWTPSVVEGLSSHWKTGEKIPKELLDKVIAARYVSEGYATLRQVFLATFDMTAHDPKSPEEAATTNLSVLYNTLRKDINHVKGPEDVGYDM